MSQPYHRFVFREGRFVGEFEEMYAAAEREGFDPWGQDALSERHDEIVEMLPSGIDSLLDVGCGKGALTARLGAGCSRVVAYDISPTAIRTAQRRYPQIDFRLLTGPLADELAGQRFGVACALEVLSYLPDWRETVGLLAAHADHILVALYLPARPAGFVRSFADLRGALREVAAIDEEHWAGGRRDGRVLLLRARSRLVGGDRRNRD